MNQYSKTVAKSIDMSPNKLEMKGRYYTTQPTYLGRIGSQLSKTVEVKIKEQEQTTFDRENASGAYQNNGPNIQDQAAKNSQLLDQIQALVNQCNANISRMDEKANNAKLGVVPQPEKASTESRIDTV